MKEKFNIVELINKNLEILSRTERKVADYILKNPSETAMMTIKQLAEQVGVSEASIVRFSRKIGLTGYHNLIVNLKERLSNTFLTSRRIENFCMDKKNCNEELVSFIENQNKYISQLSYVLNSQEFNNFCNELSTANRIFIYEDGGASRAPSSSLKFWLTRIGLDAHVLQYSGHRLFDEIINFKKGDILFAFNFGKDYLDLINLLNFCKNHKIESLVVSDMPSGNAINLTNNSIILQRGPVESFHSMSIPVLFCESLALSIAKRTGDKTRLKMQDLDKVRKEFGI